MSVQEGSNNGDPTARSIFGDSEPPNAAPHVIAAADHAPRHPFWNGRGRGGRGGRPRRGTSPSSRPPPPHRRATADDPAAPAAAAAASHATALIVDPEEERPAFTGISLRELEFVRRRNADGAESSIASEDCEVRRRRERKRRRAQMNDSTRTDIPDDERMASAAFGCSAVPGGDEDDDASVQDKRGKRSVEEGGEGDYDDYEQCEDDEDDDSLAPGSSAFGQQACGSFPIRGESCIGCVYDRLIVGKVDAFVRENCGSMTESALYRAASIFWNSEVVNPRVAEGVRVPRWPWKDLATHYELHSVDPIMQRTSLVRTLGAMRSFQEQSLLKVNADGTKQLDAKAADLMLKLVVNADKQLTALDAARMPPPSARNKT